MKVLSLFNSKWYKIIDFLTWVLSATLCLLIGFQILNRFILHIPAPWSEEFCRYNFVWLVMIASSKAMYERQHIVVDILPALFPGRMFIKIFNLFAHIFVLCFLAIMTLQTWRFCASSIGTYCITVKMPILYVYIILPIGFVSMFLFELGNSIEDITQNFFAKIAGGEQA